MRRIRWFYFLLAVTLLLASCQPAEASISPEGAAVSLAIENLADVALVSAPALQAASEARPEVNECLSCHADKDRLIETADPVEEPAESESKGVG
jgi:hypothetical protein